MVVAKDKEGKSPQKYSSQHCRQQSGSLESQSHLLSEMDHEKPFFSLSKSQRSSSTEVLDDGSSYTSQSSIDDRNIQMNEGSLGITVGSGLLSAS